MTRTGDLVPVTNLLVDGLATPGDGAMLEVSDPASEQVIISLPTASPEQLEAAVRAARRAQDHGPWSRYAPGERAAALHRFADRLDAQLEELIMVCVTDVGSPVTMAETVQTRGAIATLRTYAELAAIDRSQVLPPTDSSAPSWGRVRYAPAGVVAVLAAYNVPLAIATRSMGAALAAGCSVVLLPSPRAPLMALLLARAALDADLPAGVVNVLVGDASLAQRLTTHPAVDKIAFTGSAAVGRTIMAQAAASLKRLSMELGGKAATIVLPGTDLAAVLGGIHARYLRNAGQGCMTPGRLLVHRDQVEEFVESSRTVYASVRTGNPRDRSTTVGPLIDRDHRDRVWAMVSEAVGAGGEVLAQGPPTTERRGWYMSPVLLGSVDPSSPLAQEEIFGPVGIVLPYEDLDEAVAIANGTQYGLSTDIYGPDAATCVALAPRIRTGVVMVNGGGSPRAGVPIGGFKQSGFGREGGEWGVREFLETQYIQWPATGE